MNGQAGRIGRGLAAVLAVAAGMAAADDAEAGRAKHRRHAVMQGQPKRLPIPYAYSFYPDEIEDGVSGNLPFNNQIRKFKDPLNANGGR